MTTTLPKIFVSIASYRDPECQFTVRDLFLKAAHPERVRVGICWQYEPEQDQDCFIIESPYPQQTRVLRYLAWESKGGCWARAKALSLLEDEDYVLQIDAHMRFVPGWDTLMIESLARCEGEKVGLSTSPPAYIPPDHLEDFTGHLPVSCVLAVHGMKGLQPISLGGYKRAIERLRVKGPVPTPFVIGNFLFARRRMFEEVPFDPHIYFRGQEPVYSLRLWTHGYDLYHPDRVVIHHYWDAVSRIDPDSRDANYKGANPRAELAKQRVWHILGLKLADDAAALAELDKYGLGEVRPADAFWRFAGVDLAAGKMSQDAHWGWWTRP